MKNLNQMQNLKFLVVGSAQSGLSIAKLLKREGAFVYLTEKGEINKETQFELQKYNIDFEFGQHSIDRLADYNFVVVSPGIPMSSEFLIHIKKLNKPILSEIEVASWFLKPTDICVAVTGTNGKSTTVNYLAQLFQNDKLKHKYLARSCGNIGVSLAKTVFDFPETNLFVLELSSYQLESTYTLRPKCTILLNIQNDHLLRYENLEEYLKAKWRLILLTADDGVSIINAELMNLALKIGLPLPRAKVILIHVDENERANIKNDSECAPQVHVPEFILNKLSFGKTLPVSIYGQLKSLSATYLMPPGSIDCVYANYFKNHNNIQVVTNYNAKTWEIKTPCLPGVHNVYNILSASLAANFLDISENIILQHWEQLSSNYVHLPHRLEQIGTHETIFVDQHNTKKRLSIINDSKATNVESTLVALNSYQAPLRLLLGGCHKGDSFLPIQTFSEKNLVKVYPFGQAANIIKGELAGIIDMSDPHSSLLSAAECAFQEANDGEVILLSPGCSSFDEFQNFEHRGNVFRDWALSHIKKVQP